MFRDDEEMLTTAEVAKWLKVDQTTVRRWIKKGLLEAARLPHAGKRQEYRVTRGEVRKLFPKT